MEKSLNQAPESSSPKPESSTQNPESSSEIEAPAAEEINPHLVHAASELRDDRTRVLKHDDTFAVFDRHGDVSPFDIGAHGIFHCGTRHLSRWLLTICGERPLLLGSAVTHDNALLAVDLANPDLHTPEGTCVAGDTLHIFRSMFLRDSVCFDRFRITNHGQTEANITIELEARSDFADVFEVRGAVRPRRGRTRSPRIVPGGFVLSYEGLDAVVRSTTVTADPIPENVEHSRLHFKLKLAPGEERKIVCRVQCAIQETAPPLVNPDHAFAQAVEERQAWKNRCCEVRSSNPQFNEWLHRSYSDLNLMLSRTEHGLYPYAGVPWFSTVFGRDGIITAQETLWLAPSIARGVLTYLAKTQSTELEPSCDAEPGKILHETRQGEMATLGEVPFGRYYGSIDATPMFVMLAGAYYVRTADLPFIESIWSNVNLALEWMEKYGDRDGDGFISYERSCPTGLLQQGWKDSSDSVFHADGAQAEYPIALCEVQAYAYQAWQAGARLAMQLGFSERALELTEKATSLREAFSSAFWCEELSTYALALDGHKRPCEVVGSNSGHCLVAGLTDPERASRITATLMGDTMFSGWGIRTLATCEARYNPMSYHNGSVWPHDNALIAEGMARFGHKSEVIRVLGALFDASLHTDLHRMPELMCGFIRRSGQGPTRYPVACVPQSWSCASVFLLLKACLGLSIDAPAKQIRFVRPRLPAAVDSLLLRGLAVGSTRVDLELRQSGRDVTLNVLSKEGDAEIVVIKTV